MEIRGFRGTQEELKAQFKLSRRLEMRVGALLSLKIDLSPILLEACENSSEEETFLLSPNLMEEGPSLTKDKIPGLWKGDSNCPLALWEGEDGWKTILYQEELLAHEGFQSQPPQTIQEELLPVLSSPQISSWKEKIFSQKIFSQEELEKLRMEILTSANTDVKREGLRKVALSQMTHQEKALLFLHALGDSDLQVRRESAMALEALGLSAELTQCIKSFSQNESPQKVHSLEKLTNYLDQASPSEGAIGLHFLQKALEEERVPSVIRWICRAMEKALLKVASEEMALDLAGTLVRLLPGEGKTYEPFFRPLFEAMAKVCSPSTLSQFFHRELDGTEDHFITAFLCLLMNQLNLGDRDFRGEKMVTLLEQIPGSNPHKYRMGKALVGLGEEAIDPLISHYQRAAEGNKTYFIQVLDELGKNSSSMDRRIQLGKFFLELLESEPPLIRRVVLETALFKQGDFPPAERSAIAQALIGHLREFSSPSLQSQLKAFFANLGAQGLETLREFIDSALDDSLRHLAIDILSSSAEKLEEKEIIHLVGYLHTLESRPYIQSATLALVLARICLLPGVPKEEVEKMAEKNLNRFLDTGDFDFVSALGILGHSPYFPRLLVQRVLPLFAEQIHKAPPESIPLEADDDRVYHHDEGDSKFFTEDIPKTLEALKLWAVSPSMDLTVRQKITAMLLEKFESLQSWKVFWGPYNEARLAQVLAEICLADPTPAQTKMAILSKLKGSAHRMYVLRILGEIFEQNASVSELGEVAGEIAYGLLKREVNQKKVDREIQLPIHQLLGLLGAHHHLGGEKYDGHKIREAITRILFEGVGKRLAGLEIYLEKIAQCPATKASLKEKILKRLSHLGALQKHSSPK